MNMSRRESRKIDEATEVSEEDIEEILEDYPGAALQLAVKNGCLSTILQRFVEIVNKHAEMKNVLHHLLDLIDEENKDPVGKFCIDSDHVLYKRMAESIGDKKRIEKWKEQQENSVDVDTLYSSQGEEG